MYFAFERKIVPWHEDEQYFILHRLHFYYDARSYYLIINHNCPVKKCWEMLLNVLMETVNCN